MFISGFKKFKKSSEIEIRTLHVDFFGFCSFSDAAFGFYEADVLFSNAYLSLAIAIIYEEIEPFFQLEKN